MTSALIVTSSNTNLTTILEDMKNSIWWNHEAFFLIVNKNFENGCDIAHAISSAVWDFNILSAVYLCNDFNKQLVLYTFNPYTSLAPTFWNRVQTDHLSNEYWALFQSPLESSQSLATLFAHSEYVLL